MPLLKTFSSQVILVELVYYLYFAFCMTVNTDATGKSFVICFIPVSEDSEHTFRVTFISCSVKIEKKSKEYTVYLNSTRHHKSEISV